MALTFSHYLIKPPTGMEVRTIAGQLSALRDSGMFTQVEQDYISEEQGYITLVSCMRGVVARYDLRMQDCRIFVDFGGDTYISLGWYNTEEINQWVLPVMRSDRAWKHYTKNVDSRDLTEALDYI